MPHCLKNNASGGWVVMEKFDPKILRIAYVTNNELQDKIPGLSFSVHTVNGFRQAGGDCRLVLYRRSKKRAIDSLARRFDLEPGFDVKGVRAFKVGGSRWFFYWRTFTYLLSSDRNVLIARAANFLPWAIWWKRLKGTRVYFEAHDFWSDPTLREEPISRSRRRYVRLERRWLPKVDGIICVSKPQALLYRQCYPRKKVLAANTACRSLSYNPRREFSYVLGYIGYFREEKYPLEIVIKALSRAKKKHIELLCVGASDDSASDRLIKFARDHGVEHRLSIYPWVTGRALEELKRRIDVGIVVMTDGFLNRIASPMKMLEYMSTGIPFIATDLDGTRALMGNRGQGFLVKNDPAAWADAMDRMYADFDQYVQMVDHCLRYAQANTWRHRAETIMKAMAE